MYITKEDIQVVKNLKRCTTTLVTEKIQIKTLRDNTTHTRNQLKFRKRMPNFRQGMGQLKPSFNAGMNKLVQ